MLPSCGHFKNIPCPFFKLALCVRPHCPYKHSTENTNTRQVFPALVDETESLLDSKLGLNAPQNGSNIKTEIVLSDEEQFSYAPTPAEPREDKLVGILKTSNRPPPVPEYRPTPIAKLKEPITHIKKSNKSEYSPDYTSNFKKKKYIEEYDPLEVKCVSNKKSVSFVDPIGSEESGFDVVLVGSEDEFDDSESAPKFSDDEHEDTLPIHGNQPPESTGITEIPAEEPEVEEIQIDEFSVVDKILVDSKKIDLLLKPKPLSKSLPKVKEVVPLGVALLKQEKKVEEVNKVPDLLVDKVDVKSKRNSSEKAKKTEKPLKSAYSLKESKSKTERETKIKKDNAVDVTTKKSDSSSKKESSSTNKLKKSKNKIHKNKSVPPDKEKSVKISKTDKSKITTKESLITIKVSSETDKNISSKKKIPHVDKSSSDSDKRNTLNEKVSELKKRTTEEHSPKNVSSSKKCKSFEDALQLIEKDAVIVKHKTSNKLSTKTKSKMTESNTHQHNNVSSSKPVSSYSREKTSSIKHSSGSSSAKRKSENSDFEHEQHSSKNKTLSPKKKKMKIETSSVDSKKQKSLSPKTQKSSSPKTNKVSGHKLEKEVVNIESSDDDLSTTNCDDLSLSDSDPDEECRRIFEETYPQSMNTTEVKKDSPKEDKSLKVTEAPKPSSKSTDLLILRKQRLAHPEAINIKKPPSVKFEAKKHLNPAQVMFNRFAQVQAKFVKHFENKEAANDSSSKGHDKKRLNFAPSSGLLAAVKGKQDGNTALSNYSALPPTVSKTLKVTQRVAHIPDAATKPRPIIPAEFGNKVPSNVRQKFLNAFIDECLKFSPSEDEAYELAIEEEKKAHDRSSSKSLYMNVAANTLKRLRNQAKEGPLSKNNASTKNSLGSKTMSHQAVLNGPLAQKRSFSIGVKKQAFDIKDLGNTGLYQHLLEYVLTEEQIKENGFPTPHPIEKDRAVIEGIYANRAVYCNDAFKRTCCRCQKTYYVNVDGDYVRDEECDFHWGRLWKKRIAGSIESRYSCCQGDAESDGCCVSAGHVFEGSENHALRGFVRTLPKTPPRDKFYGVYSLDCEMCYTTAGLELTRVTVIDIDLNPVYEAFVKPQHKVLDYNTRFSGITEDDLKNAKTTIFDVQAVLLCIFNDRTILIGHSLESDFKALKIFHKTIVDTSVVFPHKNGLPFKRALRTLMAEKLNKIIQNDVGGHDSNEDAAACMELMLWKIKEDLKGNR